MNDLPQFICFLEPTREGMPDDPTEAEAQAARDHFAYYKELHARGILVLAGRTEQPPHIGIMIFQAKDMDDAKWIVEHDPAIAADVFRARIQPYRVALLQGTS